MNLKIGGAGSAEDALRFIREQNAQEARRRAAAERAVDEKPTVPKRPAKDRAA
jgi:hypothetical protein